MLQVLVESEGIAVFTPEWTDKKAIPEPAYATVLLLIYQSHS